MSFNEANNLKFHKPIKLSYNERAVVFFTRHYAKAQHIETKVQKSKENPLQQAVIKSNKIINNEQNSESKINKNNSCVDNIYKNTTKHSGTRKHKTKSYRFHGRVREYTIKLSILYRTCDMLNQSLTDDHLISTIDQLHGFEAELLFAILKRKLKTTGDYKTRYMNNKEDKIFESLNDNSLFNQNDNSSDKLYLKKYPELKSIISSIKTSNSSKRVEENNKFVCKHINAYLYTKFVTEERLLFNKESEKQFYKHYFEDYAKEKNIPITNFYDPVRACVKSKNVTKSLNTEYILRILGCDKYRVDFFEYLQTDFVADYLSAVCKKLSRLLLPLEKQLHISKEKDYPSIVSKFIKTKVESKWCKIPWSFQEVVTAKSHFLDYFNKLLNLLKYYDLRTVVKLTLHPNIFESQYNSLIRSREISNVHDKTDSTQEDLERPLQILNISPEYLT